MRAQITSRLTSEVPYDAARVQFCKHTVQYRSKRVDGLRRKHSTILPDSRPGPFSFFNRTHTVRSINGIYVHTIYQRTAERAFHDSGKCDKATNPPPPNNKKKPMQGVDETKFQIGLSNCFVLKKQRRPGGRPVVTIVVIVLVCAVCRKYSTPSKSEIPCLEAITLMCLVVVCNRPSGCVAR